MHSNNQLFTRLAVAAPEGNCQWLSLSASCVYRSQTCCFIFCTNPKLTANLKLVGHDSDKGNHHLLHFESSTPCQPNKDHRVRHLLYQGLLCVVLVIALAVLHLSAHNRQFSSPISTALKIKLLSQWLLLNSISLVL